MFSSKHRMEYIGMRFTLDFFAIMNVWFTQFTNSMTAVITISSVWDSMRNWKKQ